MQRDKTKPIGESSKLTGACKELREKLTVGEKKIFDQGRDVCVKSWKDLYVIVWHRASLGH